MDSTPTSEAPAQLAAAGSEKAAWSWNISWAALCGVLVIPVTYVGFPVVGLAGQLLHLNFLQVDRYAFILSFAIAVVLAVVVTWRGIKRGRNTPKALRWGWALAIVLLPVVMFWSASILGSRISPSSVDKFVLNNARQLAAAANQYFTENGVTTCALSDLVGSDKYVKALNLVAQETYPLSYTQGVTITVAGVAGARTITYAP